MDERMGFSFFDWAIRGVIRFVCIVCIKMKKKTFGREKGYQAGGSGGGRETWQDGTGTGDGG